MEESLKSDLSLWLSIAAFIFGGYSLWLTRRDRKYKHDLLKDHARSAPLLETNFNDFFSTKISGPEDCDGLVLFLDDLELRFINDDLQTRYHTFI